MQMNHVRKTMLLALGLLGLPLLGSNAVAEPPKPIAVVSISGAGELMGDLMYVTEIGGAGDFGRLINLMASPYTSTLDKKKPIGAYVVMGANNKVAGVSFIPVTDLDTLLLAMEEQIGKPEDVGDGVLKVAADRPQPVFVKKQGDWAFMANQRDLLGDLPKNPAKLLDGLNKKYTVAARLNVANIPEPLRQEAIRQMRKGFEESVARDPNMEEAARELGEYTMTSVIQVIDETETVTLGWEIDADNQTTYLDVALTARQDTELAEQMATVKEATSKFAGFLTSDASVTGHMHGVSSKAEIEQALRLLAEGRKQAMKGIDKDDNLANDQERDKAKSIVNQFLDILEETVKDGTVDCGGCLILKPESLAVALGGFVSDGKKVAQAVQDLAAFAELKDPNFPGIQFNAAQYKGVDFHTVKVPLGDAKEQARQVLGDPLQVVLGTGAKSVYLAFGRDASDVLKAILDESDEAADRQLPPAEVKVSLQPMLTFAASMEDNPALGLALAALADQQGQDHVILSANAIERGCLVRLQLEPGVIKALADMARAASGGRRP